MAGMALGPMGWYGYRHGSLGLTRPANFRSGVRQHRMRYRRGGRFKSGGYKKKGRRACLLGMNPEKKFVDLNVSDLPAVTGTVTLLSLIPQGDGESERVGRKAVITDILLKGFVILSATASTAASNRVRISIVQDKQTNGAAFVPADVFNTLGTADINSYRDLSHIGRFNVLFDKIYTINMPFGATQSGSALRAVSINIKCCIPIEYDASATTGAITTQQVNSLHLLTFEEAASPATTFTHVSRIRYVD